MFVADKSLGMGVPSFPLVAKISIWRWLLIWTIVGYFSLCVYLFLAYAKPSLLGLNNLRIGADSSVYLSAAGVINDDQETSASAKLVAFESNFLGPVLIAKIIPSLAGIALLNFAIFIVGLWVADSLPGVRAGPFFLLMIVNPITTPSILTLNKEILAFLGTVIFVKYISKVRRSRFALVTLLVVSLLARWEQAFVTGMFLVLEHRRSPLSGRHLKTLLLMICAITIVYPLLVRTGLVNIAALIIVAEGGKFMPVLNDIQANFGFPIIVGPKILLNLWGQVLNPSFFWTTYLQSDFSDIQNSIAIPFHCVAMFILSIIAAAKRKLNIRKQSVYWMFLYLTVSAAAPLFQPRYQYPVYVLLSLEICGLSIPSVATSPVRENCQTIKP